MMYVLLILGVIVVGAVVSLMMRAQSKKKLEGQLSSVVPDSDVARKYFNDRGSSAIAVSEKQETLYLVEEMDLNREIQKIPFSTLRAVEVEVDGSTVFKNSVTGAIVGGVLAGGVGALIGSRSGKQKELIKSLNLKVHVDSIASPVKTINFYRATAGTKGEKADGFMLATPKREIEAWSSILSNIIEKNKAVAS